MQLPSVDRTVNGPSAGADSQSAVGGAATASGTVQRATREETRVLQEQAAQQPEPSIRVELSEEANALIRSGRAEEQAGAAAGAVFVAATSASARPDVAGAEGSPTGVQGLRAMEQAAIDANAAKKAETPEALAKYLSTGQAPGPDQASGSKDAAPKDWTEKPKVEEEKPPEPPKEPISKKLLEFLQALWRAGGNAIDVAQNGNQVLNPPKESDGPITYSDPSAKKTTGL